MVEGLNHDNSEMALAGAGLWLLSLLTSATADVRHWEILPESVQVLTGEVPPGEHELRIEFLDRRGREIPVLTQVWTVEIPTEGDAFYTFRSLPGLDQPVLEEPIGEER